MTASLGSTSTAQPTRAGADVRPQVQSRRVSLKLGPLGISYSTDQVLWTEAAAVAGVGSGEGDGAQEAKPPVTPAASMVAAGRDNAGQQDQQTQQTQHAQEAQATGRTFTMELAQAWRRQVEEKLRTDQTYDRNGLASAGSRSGAASPQASQAVHTDSSQESVSPAEAATPAAASAPVNAPVGATGGATVNASSGVSAEDQTRPPASRMRQAIGAYLACARDFGTVAPMLTAVA